MKPSMAKIICFHLAHPKLAGSFPKLAYEHLTSQEHTDSDHSHETFQSFQYRCAQRWPKELWLMIYVSFNIKPFNIWRPPGCDPPNLRETPRGRFGFTKTAWNSGISDHGAGHGSGGNPWCFNIRGTRHVEFWWILWIRNHTVTTLSGMVLWIFWIQTRHESREGQSTTGEAAEGAAPSCCGLGPGDPKSSRIFLLMVGDPKCWLVGSQCFHIFQYVSICFNVGQNHDTIWGFP